ncbi:hypothetical protein [Agromyces albus]|uniref:hypothetical protein n=1 Tax=Agromyces albus TaxID=205332 RepID=UPI0013E993C9|nr:hypothetical protein [Agromyces albus]
MDLHLYPTRTQQIAADHHDDVLPAAREWASDGGGFSIDRANDRIQLRRGGSDEFDTAMRALESWMQDMRDVGKRIYAINEWPDRFELRNRFETSLTNAGYRAEPGSHGHYVVRGANSVEIGQIVVTPDGWVAFRDAQLPGATSVTTSPHPDAQGAFNDFLQADGFLAE